MPTESNDISRFILEAVMNSIEAGSDDIEIHIKIFRDGKISFRVTDNGTGIDEKYTERIFEDGFSLKSIDRGHGLYIIKKYAVESGGTAEFIKENGRCVLYAVFGTKTDIPIGDIEKTIRPLAVTACGKIRYKFSLDCKEEAGKIFSFDTKKNDLSACDPTEVNDLLKKFFQEISLLIN